MIDTTNTQVPEPSFIGCDAKGNAFIPNPLGVSGDELYLYKNIMGMLLGKNPHVNPELFFSEQMTPQEFAALNDDEQRDEYKKQGNALFVQLQSIFEDQELMCEIADMCECNFIDIFKCIYSYYGGLIFKKPQFARWMKKIVSSYSNDTKKFLEIPI